MATIRGVGKGGNGQEERKGGGNKGQLANLVFRSEGTQPFQTPVPSRAMPGHRSPQTFTNCSTRPFSPNILM